MKKIWKHCKWLQNATSWAKIKVWSRWRPVVPGKNAKNWEICETLHLVAECHTMKKNEYLMKIKPVVPGKNAKNWENCESLHLAAECHSMNKNQSLMKTSSSSEKCQKVRKFGNFTIGCRVPQHKQKSKFDQDETSSSWEKCQKLRNFETGCRMPQHDLKSKFDQDQTSSSWEKCKKSEKILKLYIWLQSATA